jgi:hypothetical protein
MEEKFMTVIRQDLNERLRYRPLCIYLDEKLVLCDNGNINIATPHGCIHTKQTGSAATPEASVDQNG